MRQGHAVGTLDSGLSRAEPATVGYWIHALARLEISKDNISTEHDRAGSSLLKPTNKQNLNYSHGLVMFANEVEVCSHQLQRCSQVPWLTLLSEPATVERLYNNWPSHTRLSRVDLRFPIAAGAPIQGLVPNSKLQEPPPSHRIQLRHRYQNQGMYTEGSSLVSRA